VGKTSKEGIFIGFRGKLLQQKFLRNYYSPEFLHFCIVRPRRLISSLLLLYDPVHPRWMRLYSLVGPHSGCCCMDWVAASPSYVVLPSLQPLLGELYSPARNPLWLPGTACTTASSLLLGQANSPSFLNCQTCPLPRPKLPSFSFSQVSPLTPHSNTLYFHLHTISTLRTF
jgi:hypothetical protein